MNIFTKIMDNLVDNKVTEWLFGESNHGAHFFGGAICSGIPMIPSAILHANNLHMSLAASVSTLCAMIGKEIEDSRNGGKFDWQDVAAGCIWPVFQTAAMYFLG